jgi:hypothetical protein
MLDSNASARLFFSSANRDWSPEGGSDGACEAAEGGSTVLGSRITGSLDAAPETSPMGARAV